MLVPVSGRYSNRSQSAEGRRVSKSPSSRENSTGHQTKASVQNLLKLETNTHQQAWEPKLISKLGTKTYYRLGPKLMNKLGTKTLFYCDLRLRVTFFWSVATEGQFCRWRRGRFVVRTSFRRSVGVSHSHKPQTSKILLTNRRRSISS